MSSSTFLSRDVTHLILTVRNHRVMLDSDLAKLYGVTTGNLNKAVKRNLQRFPEDFMFQLSQDETEALFSESSKRNPFQNGRGSQKHRDPRLRPYAFTQEGIAMLSSVLRSSRAVLVNIEIMRSFVRLRQMALSVETLSRKIHNLEQKYDSQFKIVFDAIRELMIPPDPPKRRIGFHSHD